MNTALLILLTSVGQPPTYSGDVAEILHEHCTVCHQAGAVAPFALTDYEQARKWSAMIEEVVRLKRMPPWTAHGEFTNANVLTEEERETLFAWIAAGSPAGDESYVAPQPKAGTGWRMSREPDVVLDVPEFEVPADGVIDYQYFTIEGIPDGGWVCETQVLPGEPKVVHHAAVAVDELYKNARIWIAGYTPGSGVGKAPPNAAGFMQAGTKLRVEMHYQAIGRVVRDQTKIGFVFADPAGVVRQAAGLYASDHRLSILPGKYHVSEAAIVWEDADATLHSIAPHMHLRGQSIAVIADYPDGTSEVLLDVPRFDFNWQWKYELKEASRFPAGTVLRSVAIFDNTSNNPANPDPSRRVRFGEQSSDEMHLVAYTITKPLSRPETGDKE